LLSGVLQAQPVSFASPALYNTHAGDRAIAVADLNGDGTFQTAITTNKVSFPEALAVVDFNADGKLDLAIAESNTVVLLLGNGDGTFQPPVTIETVGTFTPAVAADFNGDGKIDLATLVRTLNGGYGVIEVLPGNGNGTFRLESSTPLVGSIANLWQL